MLLLPLLTVRVTCKGVIYWAKNVLQKRDGGMRQRTVTCLGPEFDSCHWGEKENLMSVVSPVLTHYKTVTKINILTRKSVLCVSSCKFGFFFYV